MNFKITLLNTVSFIVGIVIFFGAILSYLIIQIPSEKQIRGCQKTKMFEVYLCPGSDQYARISNISPYLRRAVVLTEDSSFYSHNGFDWDEIKNSFQTNLERGQFARGGSTISQQLAKNMFLSEEKSLFRKIREAFITYKIENTLKKDEILERYLNVVQFGPNLFGVKAAAQFYFKKMPADLNIVESAFLAFLLPSPVKYSRSFFKKELTSFARKRMQHIILLMFKTNRINEDEYHQNVANLAYFPSSTPNVAESPLDAEPTLADLEAEASLHDSDESLENEETQPPAPQKLAATAEPTPSPTLTPSPTPEASSEMELQNSDATPNESVEPPNPELGPDDPSLEENETTDDL